MKYPTPWRLERLGYDPDDKARALKARFARVSKTHFSKHRSRDLRSHIVKWVLFALLLSSIVAGLFAFSPWPPLATLKHFASIQNCDAARAFGVAPARTGEPGYWHRHDADNDGIACEPYQRRP